MRIFLPSDSDKLLLQCIEAASDGGAKSGGGAAGGADAGRAAAGVDVGFVEELRDSLHGQSKGKDVEGMDAKEMDLLLSAVQVGGPSAFRLAALPTISGRSRPAKR